MSIYLRPLTLADAATSWQWRNDAEVWQYTGSRPDRAITEAIETAWLEQALQRPDERRYAICLTDTHEYIGNVQLTHITARGAQVHLFIGAKQYWGKGYGRQAIATLLQLIDHLPESERLYLQVHPDNTSAIRLYQSTGFEAVGHISPTQLLMEKRKPTSTPPTLSVFMMSYNHAAFIGQALQGVFDQEVDFPIEIVLGDDASTDNTRSIIFEYYQQRPWLFRLILQESNQGAQQNQMAVIETCLKTGSVYTAFCEGDDYWTDPNKLTTQVKLLNANKYATLCCHAFNEMSLPAKFTGDKVVTTIDIGLLAEVNLIQTVTVVLRTALFQRLPDWYSQSPAGDYPLFLLAASQGSLVYIPKEMAYYRRAQGTWSGLQRVDNLKKWNQVLALLIAHFSDTATVAIPLLEHQQRTLGELKSLLQKAQPSGATNKKTDFTPILNRLTMKEILAHLFDRITCKIKQP